MLLCQEDTKCLTFPKHFDVRFAEHTSNLLKAALNNLEAAKKVWTKMSNGTIEIDKKEKKMAEGFLKKWEKGIQQVNRYFYFHSYYKTTNYRGTMSHSLPVMLNRFPVSLYKRIF